MQQYIVGNWKMNGTKAEAKKLANGFLNLIQEAPRPLPKIILCPSYPYLVPVIDILKDSPIQVGAQDAHAEQSGAFTGDVSAYQLADIGCTHVIIGHSEHRHYHKEGSLLIRQKVEMAIKAGLFPILCIGESEEERTSGKAPYVIAEQLASDLPQEFTPHDLLIAYEPLWAIGTGRIPSLKEIDGILGLIKHELATRLSGGAVIPTLYGGSVNAKNAPDLLNLPHLDGLLVGGVSLKLEEFWQVINASQR